MAKPNYQREKRLKDIEKKRKKEEKKQKKLERKGIAPPETPEKQEP